MFYQEEGEISPAPVEESSLRMGTLTRIIAIQALTLILEDRLPSDTVLDRLFEENPQLRSLDRAFTYEMVMGGLRWLSKVDWIMNHMLNRPFTSLDPVVANALRIGAYQIYYMDRVPARAAVSESVEATKYLDMPQAASFVNAILRRVAKKSDYFAKPDKEEFPVDYHAMQYAYPHWIVERWLDMFPADQVENAFNNNNKIPRPCIRIVQRNIQKISESCQNVALYLLKTQSLESEARPLPGALRLFRMPDLKICESFAQGGYFIQDESAQLVAQLVNPQPGEKCLDACAAPGGKAMMLWDMGVEPKDLTVCDVNPARIGLLRENFQRLGIEGAEIVEGNALDMFEGRQFDKVLLDAPCSALGVVRRHPEIKWHRTPEDLDECADRQRDLLEGLAGCVAPGGELIYAVCSFEPEETVDQIAAFLERHPEFEKVNIASRVHSFYRRFIEDETDFVVYAHNKEEMDGFYAVALRKKK